MARGLRPLLLLLLFSFLLSLLHVLRCIFPFRFFFLRCLALTLALVSIPPPPSPEPPIHRLVNPQYLPERIFQPSIRPLQPRRQFLQLSHHGHKLPPRDRAIFRLLALAEDNRLCHPPTYNPLNALLRSILRFSLTTLLTRASGSLLWTSSQ